MEAAAIEPSRTFAMPKSPSFTICVRHTSMVPQVQVQLSWAWGKDVLCNVTNVKRARGVRKGRRSDTWREMNMFCVLRSR